MSELDPRPAPSDNASAVDSAGAMRPAVASASASSPPWLVGGGAVLLGLLVFLWLSSHRPGPLKEVRGTVPVETASATASVDAVPPADLQALEAQARNPAPPPPVPVPPVAPALPPPPAAVVVPPPAPAAPATAPVDPDAQRRKAPALLVDLSRFEELTASNNQNGGGQKLPSQTADELFSDKASGGGVDRARASSLRNRGQTVTQGTLIPAVLETALDSDLPGFTRAVVSRDVRSFDGSTVLIPRGSRLIGQYRSGLAQGASRAFVIWTRVLRPDGASIQIGSNGADELGRAGLAGKVDRHFFEKFSGAALLSAVTLGQAALTNGNSTQVVIGSSSDASSLAGSVSALVPGAIPPTIKVAQGTPIRVFVARDLDFSPVQDPAP